jgi:hypothetical protein
MAYIDGGYSCLGGVQLRVAISCTGVIGVVLNRIVTYSVFFILLSFCLANAQSPPASANVKLVQGVVYDTLTSQPLPYVTVQVPGTGKSALVNMEGHYRLMLPTGKHLLRFSHVGYLSKSIEVVVSYSSSTCNVYLQPTVLQIGGITAYGEDYDAAQQIIIEAIRRKKDILERIHDYRFDAYTKLVVRENPKPDSSKIWMITETQLTCFWEQPNKYKEILTARKQSSNIPAEGNLVGVGEILNFNRNRIDLGRYSIVSPTAKDALDYYNYYLKDTVYIDNRRIYRLEIEPKKETTPLFVGHISIADSTYDVVEVDVGFNKAVEIAFMDSLRYRQRFAQLENEYWMPIEITLLADVSIKFPGIPPRMSFEHRASLYDYSFDQGTPSGTFGEYDFEVAQQADKIDSSAWFARQTIPLTTEELRGYQIIDSLEKRPTPIRKKLLMVGAAATFLALGGDYNTFHFNRAEGAYLGARFGFNRLIPRTELTVKGGYGFGQKHGQFLVGAKYRLWQRQKLDVGASYYQLVVNRRVQPDSWTNPTLYALATKYDPLDYYYEKGLTTSVSAKLLNHTNLALTYNHLRQASVSTNTDFSLFSSDTVHRPNPRIDDGKLRSVSAEFTFDSRKLTNMKGKDRTSPQTQYTLFKLGAEYSSTKRLHSDFDYQTYYLSLYRRQRTAGLGLTSMILYGGLSKAQLPAQQFYQIISGTGSLSGRGGFYNISEQGFLGDRAASIFVEHDFGHLLLRGSGLPLIKKIPFTLSLHGGACWTDFRRNSNPDGHKVAPRPYGEIGFGVGNLTPFFSIFNFKLRFSWQLSDYGGNRFVVTWGIEP